MKVIQKFNIKLRFTVRSWEIISKEIKETIKYGVILDEDSHKHSIVKLPFNAAMEKKL